MSTARGVTVKDVPAKDFIAAYAKHLKRSGRIDVPRWADYAKTASFKELCPTDPDWFFVRLASMARKIYIRGSIGVGGFRKIYGGKQENGSRPSHFALSSGSVARVGLKQLEKLQVVVKDPQGGRALTKTGRRDLDRIAGQLINVQKEKKTKTKK